MGTDFSPKLEQIIADFDQPDSVAQARLISLLQQASLLRSELEKAVVTESVKHFSILQEYHAGAAYDMNKGTVELSREHLADASPRNHHLVLFQVGHETGHANRAEEVKQQLEAVWEQARTVHAQGSDHVHDYTDVMKAYRVVRREDEARAHISGFNSLVDYLKEINPSLALETLAKSITDSEYVRDFIENRDYSDPPKYQFKEGIQSNHDLSISMTSENIEAVAKLYFDRPYTEARLGPGGKSDYTNHYAGQALEYICKLEREHPEQAGKIMLDMQRLGLDPALIEANGFDAGGPGQRCEYYDTRDPDTPRYLNHTAPSGNKPEQEQSFNERYRQEFGRDYRPTSNEQFNQVFQAWFNGDEDHLNHLLEAVRQSPKYKQLEAAADELIAQQKAQTVEQTQQQEQQVQQQTAMIMRRSFHED